MRTTKESKASCLYSILSFIVIAVLSVSVVFLNSCKTIKEVPVEKVVEKIEYRDKLQIDSIYIQKKDSIYIRDRGDTVFIYKDSEIEIYKDRYIHDTLNVSRVDSIPYTVYIEKELDKYEKLKMKVGGYGIPIIIVLIIIGIAYFVRKLFG